MTQSVVTVRINDQPYQMGCDAGAENHVKTMAEEVNAILLDLKQAVGAVGDASGDGALGAASPSALPAARTFADFPVRHRTGAADTRCHSCTASPVACGQCVLAAAEGARTLYP